MRSKPRGAPSNRETKLIVKRRTPFIDVKMPRADVSTRGKGALVGGTEEGQRDKRTLGLSQLKNQST
jgi:hypothetical protein